ncbi:hypothetical protein ABZ319_02440 [Nocardia sp. NPDC005978]|uniref:hypothetical protein n=1 Tax=Nocardia sp. NPDC005978 TaxID=3156725 RepID=UPI0033BE1785
MGSGARYRLEVATLCVAAAVAGLAVTVPIDFPWAARGSVVELQMLIFNVPRATATAALAAVVVAVLCAAATMRMVWLTAVGFGALLSLSHVVARGLTHELATFGYVDAIVGGALLGALTALAGRRSLARAGLLLGALSGIIIGNRVTPSADREHLHPLVRWALVDPPSLVLLVIALGLLGWGLWRHRYDSAVPVEEIPLRPVAAVLVLVSASLIRTEVLAEQDNWFFRVIAGSVLVVLATLLAALLLPARDGVLVAMAVTFAVAGGVVGTGPSPGWAAPVLVVAVAVGLAAGARYPRPVLAVPATVSLAVFEAVLNNTVRAESLTVAGAAVTAAIGGYCFGTIVPRELSTSALALMTLVAPSVVAVITSRRFGHVGEAKVWFHGPPADPWVPGWTTVVVAIGCGAVALAVWRLRSATSEPELPARADSRPIPTH